MGLVDRHDPARLLFNLHGIPTQETLLTNCPRVEFPVGGPMKLILASHPGNGLNAKFKELFNGPDHMGRTGRTWILWTLELSSASDAVEVVAEEGSSNGFRLRWMKENVYLEVNCRKMEKGNMLFLWNDDPPVPASAHSTFVLNKDGSISPHHACPGACGGDPSQVALGLRNSQCVLVACNDPNRLIFAASSQSGKESNEVDCPIESNVIGGNDAATAVVVGTVVSSQPAVFRSRTGAMPPLKETVDIFRQELGLAHGCNLAADVDAACKELGIDVHGLSVIEKAKKCWEQLQPSTV